MRILLDIRPLLEPHKTGVGLYTENIVAELIRRDRHEYALFANSFRKEPALSFSAPPSVERVFTRVPNKIINTGFTFFGRPAVEELSDGVDAVYLPNLNFIATRKPLVVTVHDLSPVRYPHFFPAKQRLWNAVAGVRRLLERASAIVAVSEHTKNDTAEFFKIPLQKIHVVHPAADERFRPMTADELSPVREKYRLPETFFLYLGALEPRKNVESIIAAFEKLNPDCHLAIAGAKGWLYRGIFERARNSRASDRIHFLGYIPEEDKPAVINAATAFIYPSFYEGFGMPALEALACGVPVIASHASSLGEVVGSAGLLVDPHNINEIAEAMKTVLAEPAIREILRRRGLERAKSFSWQESAGRLEAIFADV